MHVVGLQYGMEAAKVAAQTLLEAFGMEDLSERQLRKYHRRCQLAFGWDFFWYAYPK
jgi:flavin-dependent dehydrogenase